MQAVKVHVRLTEDGKIKLDGLPFKKGDELEMILLALAPRQSPYMTAGDLLESDLIGMWANRTDIVDSAVFARKLRETAQRRDIGTD